MKNTIRCCISCILPCGALDVIRIVHANGRVEEISGTVKAAEIMKLHPKHILKKPTSSTSEDGICPNIVIVPPDAELRRGKIYFLIPVPNSAPPEEKKKAINQKTSAGRSRSSSRTQKREAAAAAPDQNHQRTASNDSVSMANFVISDRYLSEIMSEKVCTQRDRRRGRVGIWRPHLESISETPVDA